jgi:hypothetical protein
MGGGATDVGAKDVMVRQFVLPDCLAKPASALQSMARNRN